MPIPLTSAAVASQAMFGTGNQIVNGLAAITAALANGTPAIGERPAVTAAQYLSAANAQLGSDVVSKIQQAAALFDGDMLKKREFIPPVAKPAPVAGKTAVQKAKH